MPGINSWALFIGPDQPPFKSVSAEIIFIWFQIFFLQEKGFLFCALAQLVPFGNLGV